MELAGAARSDALPAQPAVQQIGDEQHASVAPSMSQLKPDMPRERRLTVEEGGRLDILCVEEVDIQVFGEKVRFASNGQKLQ